MLDEVSQKNEIMTNRNPKHTGNSAISNTIIIPKKTGSKKNIRKPAPQTLTKQNSNKFTEEEREKIKNQYIADLYTDYRYGIEKFDTQALYISSGALAISLTFLKDIVPIKDSKCLILFYLSIILLGITISVGFIAHFVSANKIEKRIKKIENEDIQNNKDWIGLFNWITLISLICGIGLLITFTIINMTTLKINSNDKQSSQAIFDKQVTTNHQ